MDIRIGTAKPAVALGPDTFIGQLAAELNRSRRFAFEVFEQGVPYARETIAEFAEFAESSTILHFTDPFYRRGLFSYDLDDISPADYRRGVLERGARRALRIWLGADVLFEPAPDGGERLSEEGRTRVESAMGAFVKYGRGTLLIVEGYATAGSTEEQFLASRARASLVRDYVVRTFHRDQQSTGIMPLSAAAPGSPDDGRWDGVAIAVFPGER